MTDENGSAEIKAVDLAWVEYTVVLRAQSAARFLPEGGWELNLDAVPGLGLTSVRVRTFTRWVPADGQPLPRELIVEVRGCAASLDEAIDKFAVIARPIATMVGFVANVRVGPVEAHLAYESTASSNERPFVEVFLADERGAVTEGRIIRQHLMVSACTAFLELTTDSARISRGLRQYELALREWYLGGEWLALSHLYMAVETLTKAVSRKAAADRGITEKALAESLSIDTGNDARRKWPPVLASHVREQMIFARDSDTYLTAKDASDGLEHGYLELGEIAAHALKCADKTFYYVRRTIVDLLGVPGAVADELMTIKPKDVQSRRKVVRGRLIGAAEDPAAEGELYPLLEWSSAIASVVREGSTFQMRDKERFTVRTHPDISFQIDRLEVVGRVVDGVAPVETSGKDMLIEPTPEPQSGRMLAAVIPMVNAATASGAATGHSAARVLAFNLFGQGVAFYESAHTLISNRQPLEALPALRALTIIASRFEQITDDSGPGIGLAVWIALGTPRELGASPKVAAEYRRTLLDSAASADIAVPEDVAEPETTAIYRSLTNEMQLAQSIANGGYGAIGFHVKGQEDQQPGFHTQLDPGPVTELVASACVIAQLELLKHAALLFGWTIDDGKVDNLLREARELNEASANPESD